MFKAMQLRVIVYPNPILRKKPAPVSKFDSTLAELTEAMFTAMEGERGVGLAAPQVGILLRLLVIHYDEYDVPKTVLANPEIIESEGMESMAEGCLSFPGIFAEIKRPSVVRVRAQNLAGETVELSASGVLARVVQHEMDHLEGRLFIDLFSPAQKIRFSKDLRNLEKRFAELKEA
ncbi:MAG: peptide deformylase [Candidatus Brocadiia bacterium]